VARAQEEVQKQQAELARLECDRGQRLLAAGSITRADYDRRMSQCASSKAALAAAQDAARLARKAVSDASIRAPFAGVIGERFVNVGQYVRPDSRIVSLFAIDPLRLELTVPEAEVGAVRKDTKVEFRVAAYNENFTGVVRFISPNVREKSRDLVVEAVVRNADGRVKPGMFAVARIAAGEAPAPVLPASAVRRGEVDSRVFAVEEGRAAERIVQLGEERDGWVAVQSGVRAGDKVVASPDEQIRDGVKIVEQN
jgi:membrane fusion protein (multidrug efflux system)